MRLRPIPGVRPYGAVQRPAAEEAPLLSMALVLEEVLKLLPPVLAASDLCRARRTAATLPLRLEDAPGLAGRTESPSIGAESTALLSA